VKRFFNKELAAVCISVVFCTRRRTVVVVVDDDFMNSSDSFPASMAQRIALILLPLMTSPPPPPPHKAPLEKLHGCSTVAARALRPSRQESQTAQRRPHRPDTNSSPQSCTVRAATLRVFARWSTSSLSLSDPLWLPAHAPCLLYYSSLHSCTVRATTLRVRSALPSKPLEELHRCSPSVCDHFVRDSARVLNSVVLREFHTE
jgi:hypothetical protein